MKIGLYTDSLGDLGFEPALDWVVSQGLQAVEIGTGNFSPAPHCDIKQLIGGAAARKKFSQALANRNLELSALNCNGNPLDPHPDRRKSAQQVVQDTLEAANLLGLRTIVTMSGCPGDLGGGTYPNWVTCTWQREYVELLERQWQEEITPYWEQTARRARELGVRIAIEMHPGQAVYNTRTLQRLRRICGEETVGANLDPSHFFFQAMDPLVVVRALGVGAVFHVHAKDTRINLQELAVNGALDTRPMSQPGVRSWEYVTLGFGHDELFWRNFLSTLRMMGYDGVLSIEHEDRLMSPREGIQKSIAFLRAQVLTTVPSG